MTSIDLDPVKGGTFYKYRPICAVGTRDREYLLRTITHSEIFFASAKQFNDVYDCRPYVTMSEPEKFYSQRIEALYRERKKPYYRVGPNLARTVSRDTVAKMSEEKARVELLYETLAKSFGLYCMSKMPDSPSQWDRYAGNYKGLCFEFFVPEEITDVFEIVYSDQRASVDLSALLSDDDSVGLQFLVLTKLTEWEHEREVRALAAGGPGVRDVNPMLLQAIVFGPNTLSDDEQLIRTTVDRVGLDIVFKRAVESGSGSTLEIVPA